jgi:hypothetical protein
MRFRTRTATPISVCWRSHSGGAGDPGRFEQTSILADLDAGTTGAELTILARRSGIQHNPGMSGQAIASSTESLAGLVERVTFHSAETGFCVLRVKVRGHRDLVVVVGHAAMISAGEWVQASGSWVNDRTHGGVFQKLFVDVIRRRPEA